MPSLIDPHDLGYTKADVVATMVSNLGCKESTNNTRDWAFADLPRVDLYAIVLIWIDTKLFASLFERSNEGLLEKSVRSEGAWNARK